MDIIKHIKEQVLNPPSVDNLAIFVVIQNPLSLTMDIHMEPEKAASAIKIGCTLSSPTVGASSDIAVIMA